jgi:hypothetical protein
MKKMGLLLAIIFDGQKISSQTTYLELFYSVYIGVKREGHFMTSVGRHRGEVAV